MRLFKLILVILLAVFIVNIVPRSLFSIHSLFAQSEEEQKNELEKKIQEYEAQIKGLQEKANTLTNQISQFDAQINLTQLKILQTEDNISLLTSRITQLTTSLDSLNKAYTSRAVETYKMTRFGDSPFVVLASEGLKDALSQYQYLKLAQKSDQELLARLTKAQTGYQTQKKDLEVLNQTLATQKKTLDGQKQAKSTLLSATRNDEKKYQALLADAQKQLAAFKHFTQGASILTNQTKCNDWGCYYNQRDSQWANQTIGLSSNTMKDVGCLITSMAMIASHYGKNLKPSDIAGSSNPFLGSTAYMLQVPWSLNGVTMTRVRIGSSTSAVDSELSANRPVIVGIYGGPDHFLVIKRKEGSNYIMNDPFVENGSDIKFTDKYPISAITAVDRVTVN